MNIEQYQELLMLRNDVRAVRSELVALHVIVERLACKLQTPSPESIIDRGEERRKIADRIDSEARQFMDEHPV